MASLVDLPPELLLMVAEHLDDDSRSLKSFALTCRHTPASALKIHEKYCLIDLSAGNTQVVHKVMSHLLSLAHEKTITAPDIEKVRTGHRYADRVVKLASKFTAIRVRLDDSHGTASPANHHRPEKYLYLVSLLEPRTMYGSGSWQAKFLRGAMHDLLRFLLRVTQHITTFEMAGPLHRMRQTDMRGMCPALHTLRLTNITDSSLSRSCCVFVHLPTLQVLEFAQMAVTFTTLKYLTGILSVSSLRFIDCWASPSALSETVKACRALHTFEYTLSADLWAAQPVNKKQYDLAKLVFDLSKQHGDTLINLTVLTGEVEIRDRCHYAEELSQLKVLRKLVMNRDHLHPHHFECEQLCDHRRLRQRRLFADDRIWHQPVKSPIDILLSLTPSIQRVELHDCDKTLMTYTLLNIMHAMQTVSQLPDLCTIKVTFKRPQLNPSRLEQQELSTLIARLGGRGRSQALREKARPIPTLHLELHDL